MNAARQTRAPGTAGTDPDWRLPDLLLIPLPRVRLRPHDFQWDASAAREFTSGESWAHFAQDSAHVKDQAGAADSMLESFHKLIRWRKKTAARTRGRYRKVPCE